MAEAFQKDTMLGTGSSPDAVAATTFGGDVLDSRRVMVESSSSSEGESSTGPTRRSILVAKAKERYGKHCSDKEGKDCSDKEAKDCSDKEAKDCSEKEANDCSDKEAIEDIEAPGVGKRQPSKVRQSPRTRADAATSDAVAARTKLPPSEVRSTETAVVTVSMNRRRSCKTKAVEHIKAWADLQHKQRVVQTTFGDSSSADERACRSRGTLQHRQGVVQTKFGDSSSGEERACRSRGTHVKGYPKHGRVHDSVQTACRRDDRHTRHHRRRTQDSQKKWVHWPDVRSLPPVDARSGRQPLPSSFARELPPKKTRLIATAAREKRSERPQSRTSVALPQERHVQLEERAEPWDAESTTWALDSVQSRPPFSTLSRIFNLVFVTSYVADSVDIVCFRKWLLGSSHHCIVILCESRESEVAEWLMACRQGGSDEQEVAFLQQRKVTVVTTRDFVVTKSHKVELIELKQFFEYDSVMFAVADILIHDKCATAMHGRSTKVGVGVLHVLPQLRQMPDGMTDIMSDSVLSGGVRCFTGVFGRCVEQISSLASKFPMATSRPLCQMWRGAGRHADSKYVFPSYTLLLGSSTNASTTSKLLESEVAVKNKWVSTVYPYEEVMPQWRKMPPAQVDESGAYDIDWGHVKEKKMDPARWIPHMHQVFWWCGTATQGDGARSRMQEGRHMPPKRELPCDRSCGHASSSSKTNPQLASRKANPWPDMKDWQ